MDVRGVETSGRKFNSFARVNRLHGVSNARLNKDEIPGPDRNRLSKTRGGLLDVQKNLAFKQIDKFSFDQVIMVAANTTRTKFHKCHVLDPFLAVVKLS